MAKGAAGLQRPSGRRGVAGEYGALPVPPVARERVLGIQRKLHKWASDDPNRRFKDLHNLVCDRPC